MYYRVTEYLGDYPLEGQVNWGKTFPDLPSAYDAADETWKVFNALDPDYHVLVELYEDGGDLGLPVMAWTCNGILGAPIGLNNTPNGLLLHFLGRFE